MSKLAILHTTIRRRRAQNSINTGREPAIQIPLLVLLALDMQLPVLDTGQRLRLLVHLHLGAPGLARPRQLPPDGLPAVRDEHAVQQLGALGLVYRRPIGHVVACIPEALHGRL